MDQCTDDFGCIVIDNTAKSNRLEDQVFWCPATASASALSKFFVLESFVDGGAGTT